MLYSLKDRFNRWRFELACKGILSVSPVNLERDSPIAVMTQLQHKDVLLATIAFKSFAARVPVGAYYALDDGSLTEGDKNFFRRHIPSVLFLSVADAHSDNCPRGGCWERLLTISNLVKDHYVIQLDSDTLTLGNVPEILECAKDNRSFVIGTWDGQDFETMKFRHEKAIAGMRGIKGDHHIQLTAEANFDKLKRFNELKYVRGCAGFAGFGKSSFDRAFVDEVSSEMFDAIGERWREWGSEQVMSNIVVANTPSNRVLPHPKYCDCTRIKPGETAFIHFIGSCRFVGGTYAKLARQVIRELLAKS